LDPPDAPLYVSEGDEFVKKATEPPFPLETIPAVIFETPEQAGVSELKSQ